MTAARSPQGARPYIEGTIGPADAPNWGWTPDRSAWRSLGRGRIGSYATCGASLVGPPAPGPGVGDSRARASYAAYL